MHTCHTQKPKTFPLLPCCEVDSSGHLECLFSHHFIPAPATHRWQPTGLPHPWDSPGQNTGVGCHFLLQCMKVKSASKVAQSCPTLCNPTDCSLPASSIHGIFQARVLEWGAIAFSDRNMVRSYCLSSGVTHEAVR